LKQRGRKSASNVITLDLPPRLTTPAGLLNVKERKLFDEIIGAVDAKHFRAADVPLLAAYAQALAMVHTLARSRRIPDWERASRVAAMFATKLRLTPQSRLQARTVGRHQPSQVAPWHRDPDDAE
jgi:hypothetical protein